MNNLCTSSETYLIATNDLATLADSRYAQQYRNCHNVIILLGNLDQDIPDTLLCGREIIQQAVANGEKFVAARIAFYNQFKCYDLITPFIKKLRRKHKVWSSNIYHMDPFEIRRMRIERSFRDRNNAYTFSNPLYQYTENERKRRYQRLCDSMKKGYNDKYPIEIMLSRMLGIKDTVNNGHHRMATALDCKLSIISVRFSAAGQAPALLRPILKVIADIAVRFKQKSNA